MTTTILKERPILFSGPMVRAILEGRKSQTRRIVKSSWWRCLDLDDNMDREIARCECHYGRPGERLWVRETWKVEAFSHQTPTSGPEKATYYLGYKADVGSIPRGKTVTFPNPVANAFQKNRGDWRPSIHLPRWASRITLEIVSVRVQRVQEISEEDAEAEGIDIVIDQHRSPWCASSGSDGCACGGKSNREHFALLWDSINAKRGFGWEKNPWVWALTFKRCVV